MSFDSLPVYQTLESDASLFSSLPRPLSQPPPQYKFLLAKHKPSAKLMSSVLSSIQKQTTPSLQSQCEIVLNELKAYTKHSLCFLTKVSKREAPDYYDGNILSINAVIKHPMDLSTLTKKVRSGVFKTKAEFFKDVRLIFDNCLTYNTHPDSIFRVHAKEMIKKSDELATLIINDEEEEEEAEEELSELDTIKVNYYNSFVNRNALTKVERKSVLENEEGYPEYKPIRSLMPLVYGMAGVDNNENELEINTGDIERVMIEILKSNGFDGCCERPLRILIDVFAKRVACLSKILKTFSERKSSSSVAPTSLVVKALELSDTPINELIRYVERLNHPPSKPMEVEETEENISGIIEDFYGFKELGLGSITLPEHLMKPKEFTPAPFQPLEKTNIIGLFSQYMDTLISQPVPTKFPSQVYPPNQKKRSKRKK